MRLTIQDIKHCWKWKQTELRIFYFSVYIFTSVTVIVPINIYWPPVSCFINCLVKSSALVAMPAVSAFKRWAQSFGFVVVADVAPVVGSGCCCCLLLASLLRFAARFCGIGWLLAAAEPEFDWLQEEQKSLSPTWTCPIFFSSQEHELHLKHWGWVGRPEFINLWSD